MTDNLSRLVTLLNDGEFHDGTTLGDSLQITRSAVWKMIKKLIEHGIYIESIKGKGYRLLAPLILLNENTIKQSLINRDLPIDIFETINSTNTYLRRYLTDKKPRLCLAEQQTQGKGRLGRQWHSPFAQNIYFSYLHHFTIDLSQLAGLSLVISLAVNKSINQYIKHDKTSVKWPNDIYYHHRKLAGILIDVQAENHGHCSAIIGIGINVNMTSAAVSEIDQAWTSLNIITNHYIDRNMLCADLIKNIQSYLTAFEMNGLAHFIEEWNEHDLLLNRNISIHYHERIIKGLAKGINQNGQLILEEPNGITNTYASGDTSIIK
jgi:BirA family biotin operon repressor/biotin-[acetyl-CoA-carboxylase] ligase